MLRIPGVLTVKASGTGECRWHLANCRKQPDGDQSQFHDQPLGIRSICPTADDFYAGFRQASYARTHATKLFRTEGRMSGFGVVDGARSRHRSAVGRLLLDESHEVAL